jgi:glyoxylase-like metal-dependent hydrolase (beta-lactamase superfamily II)
MSYRVITIGAFARHPLRPMDATRPERLGYATTTLIVSGEAAILVDPGLPAQALIPRLLERAGLEPADITHVFLTRFAPETARGLTAFESATWMTSEAERESAGTPLALMLRRAMEDDDADRDVVAELEAQVRLLARCEVAPDSLAPRVDLFPLPGVSPGLTGLLLPEATSTVLIAGDAVASAEHLEQGRALEGAHDPEAASESLREAIEVADLIVCGRDNLVLNPTKRPF